MKLFRTFAAIALAAMASLSAIAMSVRPPSFDELVTQADSVIRTEVLGTRCVIKGEGAKRHIVTFVKVRVERVLVGEGATEMELEMLGGTVGTETMEVGGMTTFTKGDRDILFVKGNGQLFCPLVGVNHGRYLIVPREGQSGEFVARADNLPLRSEADVSVAIDHASAQRVLAAGAEEAMTTADFESRIIAKARGLGRKVPASAN